MLTDSNLYSFRLTFPENGSPSYTILDIEPEREIEASTPSINPQLTRTEGIAIVEQGLEVAHARGLIEIDEPLWQRTQTFLSLIKEGMTAEDAASQAGISQFLIIRLTELGQTSPTLAI